MSWFIKLHLREPKYEINYLGNRIGYTKHQVGWHDVKGDDNIIWKGLSTKIETTDLKYLNETEDEILEESLEALIFF